jgi:hypothetical protein
VRKYRWRLLGAFVTLLVGGALFVPAVYWHLYGWANAEPFWEGRPVTYWRQQVRQMLTKVGRIQSGRAPEPYAFVFRFPDSPPNGNGDPADAIIDAIGRGVGTPGSRSAVLYSGSDARQMPVLIALVLDTDPLVRGWAVWSLGKLGWSRHVERDDALVPLEAMTHDAGQLEGDDPRVTVGELAVYAIARVKTGKTRPGKPKTNARAEPSGVIYEDPFDERDCQEKAAKEKTEKDKAARPSPP